MSIRLGIVIPACNEEALLPRCLTQLEIARSQLPPNVSTDVVLVLDSCTDRSADVAAHFPWVRLLPVTVRSVGVARRMGVAELGDDIDWICSTDADSAVPISWLEYHTDAYLSGMHLLLGTVVPDTLLADEPYEAWRKNHQLGDDHPHVHGANLGMSARAYWAVGGFDAAALHEDVLISDRIKAAGFAWKASGAIPVLTSGRSAGRAAGGFAEYLRQHQLTSLPRRAPMRQVR